MASRSSSTAHLLSTLHARAAPPPPASFALTPPTSASVRSSGRYACASPSYIPSPRSCHSCPLFATCRLHHHHASPVSLSSSQLNALFRVRRRDFNTSVRLAQVEVSVPSERTAVPGKNVGHEDALSGMGKGKGKEKEVEGAKVDAVETRGGLSETKRKQPSLRPRKEVITLTPAAIQHLAQLLELPEPKLIRVGVKNKGCAGMSYHLEYVDKPGKFDEVVKAPIPSFPASSEVGEVQVVIDSKALFSIIGSEMDWEEGRMGSKFVFKNPNIKEQCGCGESFMI